MQSLDLMRLQAAHNTWMNHRLFAVCVDLTDEERKRDLGAFFGSIHGTFNHLLLADRVWLGRLTDRPFPIKSLAQELYSDFEELRRERERTDADIEAFIDGLTEADLERELHYTSAMTHDRRAYAYPVVLTHLFHHQTHHRGQITTLIGQLGHDFGETDLILMPGLNRLEA
jgi:uncharacterized damage-inducible protein DinB